VTGTDGAAHTPAPSHGWTEPPSTDNWRAPGIDIIDRLVDQQDALDLVARARELAEAHHARSLVEAEVKERKKGST
jgi:hypothetical protein